MIDKRPALIARCTGTADVVAAVRFAREHDLLVAVRGGGHNVAGNAVNDGGLVIDLSPMKGIQVDPVKRTARVQPGATWGDARPRDAALRAGDARRRGLDHRHRRLHARRRHGRCCTASGGWPATTCSRSRSSPPTARCGGPARPSTRTSSGPCAAAAATSASSPGSSSSCTRSARRSSRPSRLYAARGRAGAPARLARLRGAGARRGDERSAASGACRRCRILPAELHGAPVVIFAGLYAGPVDEGERALLPLREFGDAARRSQRRDDLRRQSRAPSTRFFPTGRNYYWKSLFLDELDDDLIDADRRPASRRARRRRR